MGVHCVFSTEKGCVRCDKRILNEVIGDAEKRRNIIMGITF